MCVDCFASKTSLAHARGFLVGCCQRAPLSMTPSSVLHRYTLRTQYKKPLMQGAFVRDACVYNQEAG
ncbi:MAG: hypothetical protein H6R05_972 [Burkholderiaceae bacterium]|nr:hypothetical protein [Burkholderiaceae bacterium]